MFKRLLNRNDKYKYLAGGDLLYRLFCIISTIIFRFKHYIDYFASMVPWMRMTNMN